MIFSSFSDEMISTIELRDREGETLEEAPSTPAWVVALVLGLILCFQIGLVLWVSLE